MQTNKIILPFLAMTLVLASAAEGQIIYNQPGSSGLRFYYNNWKVDNPHGADDALSQATCLLSGFVPLRDNFEARYHIITGYNNLDLGGTESKLSGLGDLKIQLSHSFAQDKLLLSAGLNVPTGKKELDTTGDQRIIEFLSRDYLSFPLRRYGEGFGLNIQAGGARELGLFKCGASAVFDYCGSYEPYEKSGDYNPGDAFSLNATTSVTSGNINYTGDLCFSVFGTDKLDDDKIYKQAPQFITRLTATYPKESYSATLGIMMILRGRNTRYGLTDGIIESQLKKYGDEFDVFFRMIYTTAGNWRLAPLVGTRQILSSEEELGKSFLFNFGFDINKDVAERVLFDVGLMYHAGSTDEGAVGIRGFQVSGGLSVTY